MQASDRVLALRYAKALFLTASRAGEADALTAELAAARVALDRSWAFLRHPRVSALEKKRRMDQIAPKNVSRRTLDFLKLLADKKRLELLPLVAAEAGRLVAEKNNILKAVVRAARPIPVEFRARLKERLEEFSGSRVELEVKEDAELIGGLIVRLGDWIMDSSLKGRLRQVREAVNGH